MSMKKVLVLEFLKVEKLLEKSLLACSVPRKFPPTSCVLPPNTERENPQEVQKNSLLLTKDVYYGQLLTIVWAPIPFIRN